MLHVNHVIIMNNIIVKNTIIVPIGDFSKRIFTQ